MKFFISYFYQIRFFKPNMIPVSTALRDPKWYQGDLRKDKNGVYLGLNDYRLHPSIDSECPKCTNKDATKCSFIKNYFDKISKLNFKELIESYEILASKLDIRDPIIVLMVYEAPNNSCSERSSLIKLFEQNGMKLEEFNDKKEI